MSYPNRNHVSRADRHHTLTGGKQGWAGSRTAGYQLTETARRALGLTGDRYPKDMTAEGVLPDGRPVKLVRGMGVAGSRKGMLMRRIQVLCDQCNQWIPMGRIQQHEGTGACYKNRGRGRTTRDPQRDMPGQKNRTARRKAINSWGSRIKQGQRALPLIGRRKTVRTKPGRLITRKSQKATKRAMFRMGQKSKLLACHACSRNDFATEKSLKRHTAKFHTPGQKSPRGFRTRRDPAGGRSGVWKLVTDRKRWTLACSFADACKAAIKEARQSGLDCEVRDENGEVAFTARG